MPPTYKTSKPSKPVKVATPLTSEQLAYRVAAGVGGLGLAIIVLSAIFFGTPKATVTGRVTFRGKPVVWGSVVVAGKDGRTAAGPINPDGTYTVVNAPTDAVSIAVVSRDPLIQTWATNLKETRDRPSKKVFSAPPIDRKLWFPLPPKYEEPANSGITVILSRGENSFNVELH